MMSNRFQTPFDNAMGQTFNGPNALFEAIQAEIEHKKNVQTFRKLHWYTISGSVTGQASTPYTITTTQGKDFDCRITTGYAFSYDAGNATDFPAPNDGGLTAWAADGLSVSIRDANSGTDFMNGDVPFKILFTPGYGIGFQNAMPFEFIFPGNSKIKITVTNRDNANRSHSFAIVFGGFLVDS